MLQVFPKQYKSLHPKKPFMFINRKCTCSSYLNLAGSLGNQSVDNTKKENELNLLKEFLSYRQTDNFPTVTAHNMQIANFRIIILLQFIKVMDKAPTSLLYLS